MVERRSWALVAVPAAVVGVGWVVRRVAVHAHSTGIAGVTPQAPSRDPARLVPAVRGHAEAAGVNPVLLMAILYAESYKPHVPLLERAWQVVHRDSAFGVANMHRLAYERTRPGRPFAGRAWTELPGDPDLAVQAAAWHLHDLRARLPLVIVGTFTADELVGMGYNAGVRNMLRFAHGTPPGPRAAAYLDRLREHWQRAEAALAAPQPPRPSVPVAS
ncbi:lysozyme family protein [Actinophytocola xanthii]|uniref:lytic transglycosylase domain-containing protein n=1 Tax=Actinophytocola xanthii TaxID=1912961 RepID=UPI0018E935EC|nr:lytic transglycosylase domain-containing protein [Actinophytocola xanthii]